MSHFDSEPHSHRDNVHDDGRNWGNRKLGDFYLENARVSAFCAGLLRLRIASEVGLHL